MNKLHEQVRAQIEKMNEQYKAKSSKSRTHLEFKLGGLVWLYLGKEKFSVKGKNKPMARENGPYKIVQRVGDNAYKIELPGDINISATFNIRDFTPYIEDEGEGNEDLRANLFQGREVDAIIA